MRIDFPPVVEPLLTTLPRPITWGTTARRSTIGRFSDTYSVLQGRLDNENVIRRGGVIALPEFSQVNVHEIIRCTALAQRRRREILGVTCSQDPLTVALAETLGRRAPLNHWSQPWSDVLTGLAYASQGKSAQAVAELQKAVTIAGQFDHPLTATALIELGKLHFDEEQYEAAATYFMEATYVAAWFSQFNEMEEAFRRATTTYLISGTRGVFPPLEPAVAWSRRTSRLLEASLLTCELRMRPKRTMRQPQCGWSNKPARQRHAPTCSRGPWGPGCRTLRRWRIISSTMSPPATRRLPN